MKKPKLDELQKRFLDELSKPETEPEKRRNQGWVISLLKDEPFHSLDKIFFYLPWERIQDLQKCLSEYIDEKNRLEAEEDAKQRG